MIKDMHESAYVRGEQVSARADTCLPRTEADSSRSEQIRLTLSLTLVFALWLMLVSVVDTCP